ncbi:MAG: class II fructose-bisphosphate aldolase [Planctomycetota bacterium]|jgi:fructose/tagatose bisphosphate aldolase
MKLYENVRAMLADLGDIAAIRSNDTITVQDAAAFREKMDDLIAGAVFSEDERVRNACRWVIREGARVLGVIPASIHEYYITRGKGEYHGCSIPAINVRGMTYDVVRQVVRAAMDEKVGHFILELAKSETGYTNQPPREYATVCIAAACREGYEGPLYVQGDHYQVSMKKYKDDPETVMQELRDLIAASLEAGYWNIDIDASTTVDLSQPTVPEQQRNNFEISADLTAFIREMEKKLGAEKITVSIGGEIGEVGKKNSTAEELRAYLEGFREALARRGENLTGLSKVSIQTGTSHGGVVLPDGSIAEVAIDFDVLKELDVVAREFGLGGVVQHGASTLPDEAFDKFPENNTLEVHLATGFQNIQYDCSSMPEDLKKEIYAHLSGKHGNERKEGWTDEQFYYKLRKKGFGPFKKQWWNLPADVKGPMIQELYDKFVFLYRKLGVSNTLEQRGVVTLVEVPTKQPPGLEKQLLD